MTQKLLKASIAKWETALFSNALGANNCPLCSKYNQYSMCSNEKCNGCVVREYTGSPFCDGTPFLEAASCKDAAQLLNSEETVAAWEKAKAAEITFLKTLLTKEELE